MRRVFLLTAFAILAAGPRVASQTAKEDNWALHSAVLNEDRAISVHLPSDYAKSEDKYPVLYVLDGETLFEPVAGDVEWLQYVLRTPGMIVVGISNTHRIHDFTTSWTSSTPPGPYQGLVTAAGGADNFLRFIQEELIPQIERKYRAAPFRILVGHSLGGLFAMHAFASAPSLFNATIAISPALSWNGEEVTRQLTAETSSSQRAPRALYMCVAGEGGDTLSSFQKLEEALRVFAPASLRWQTHIYADEDHGTVVVPAAQAGLQFVFHDWRLPSVVTQQGMDSIERYYASLSHEYGYTIPPPETQINALGYFALQAKDTKSALRIFELGVKLYPRSANVYDSLADGLEADGQLAGAREMCEKAVQLGNETKDPRTELFKQHLQAVTAKLQTKPDGSAPSKPK